MCVCSSDCLMLYEPEVANKACQFDLTSMRWHLVVTNVMIYDIWRRITATVYHKLIQDSVWPIVEKISLLFDVYIVAQYNPMLWDLKWHHLYFAKLQMLLIAIQITLSRSYDGTHETIYAINGFT